MTFECIYADPPWSYKVYSQKGQGRSAENHYHTMNKEDIYNLDVAGIAAKDWLALPLNVNECRYIIVPKNC